MMERLSNWLDNISKPNPKYLRSKPLYDMTQNRIKTILILVTFIVLFFIAQYIQNTQQNIRCIGGILCCFLVIFVLLISCRTHPEVFNIFYNIILTVYGVLQLYNEETIHYSYKAVNTYPILVLLFTGSIYHCIIQAGVQLILLKTLYEPALIKTLNFMLPEVFAKNFSRVSIVISPWLMIFIIFLQFSLQKSYERISESEKKKEEAEKQKVFLLGFSHELRNLINSIIGNVNLAMSECIPSKGKSLLTNAEFCGKLLLHLVNNILDTGKAEIGDLEINLIPTKIYDTIENIWSICSELIKRKNLRGKMTIQKNIPPMLNMDHYRLTQIFLNLIGNAVKFTDNGSINISVDWLPDVSNVNDKCFEPRPFDDENEFDEGIFEKHRRFSIFDEDSIDLNTVQSKINRNLLKSSLDAHKGILKVAVSDTGLGIDNDAIKKLFQKFAQVSVDPSKRKLGTGLGLFITKELCNRMGGDIKVFSKQNKGTCFIFCIPMAALPYSSQEIETLRMRSSPAILTTTRRLKAMIVDDIEFCRDVLKNYFQKLNIDVVETAENGLEAYKKFIELNKKKNMLNIITMDLDMPLMNGKESARVIREFERENGLEPSFIIIASGNCGHAEIQECLDKRGSIRADVFLKKPLTISDISRVISENFNLETTSL